MGTCAPVYERYSDRHNRSLSRCGAGQCVPCGKQRSAEGVCGNVSHVCVVRLGDGGERKEMRIRYEEN